MKKQMEEDQRRYPLYWPEGFTRTRASSRQRARYKVSPGMARDDLQRELTAMGARRVVVSTNIPYRADGLPYANMRKPDDVGVAVYWTTKDGSERVIACDKWDTVEHNLRAVGLAIEAIRALERTGASDILERAFRGFTALPASTSSPKKRTWREVLGFHAGAFPTADVLKDAYRTVAKIAHPDRGGSQEAFVELEQAYAEAKDVMGYT